MNKNKKPSIALYRRGNGLGDAICLRQILRPLKEKYPDYELTLACMPQFFDAYVDHPCIDNLMHFRKARYAKTSFDLWFDVSTICNQTERKLGKDVDIHRAEIWGKHCGVIPNQSPEITIDPEVLEEVKKYRPDDGKPWCLFAPTATATWRSLSPANCYKFYKKLEETYHVNLLVSKPEDGYECLIADSIQELFAAISLADYVVTVDTSIFWIASGLEKKTLALFGPTSAEVISKFSNKEKTTVCQGACDIGPCYLGHKCPITRNKYKPCMEFSTDLIDKIS